jgi:hypothetical protein
MSSIGGLGSLFLNCPHWLVKLAKQKKNLKKFKTRLKISLVLTRVQKAISIGTQGSKSQCLFYLQGKLAINCRPTAVRKLAILPAYGR